MAKCKICKTNIPDGKEYCNNCQDKELLQSKESYLDGLLNSVKKTAPTADSIYKKKNSTNIEDKKTDLTDEINSMFLEKVDLSDFEDNPTYSFDADDIKDYDLYSDNDDVDDIHDYSDLDQYINDTDKYINNIDKYIDKEDEDTLADDEGNDMIGDEELFGDSLTNLLSVDDNIVTREEGSESAIYDDIPQTLDFTGAKHSYKEEESNNYQTSNPDSEVAVTLEMNPTEVGKEEQMKNEDNLGINTEAAEDNDPFTSYNMSEFEDNDFDPDLNDLLNSLEQMEDSPSMEEEPEEYNTDSQELQPTDSGQIQENEPEDDDFLALLNQISSDDPVAEDVMAINSLLNGGSVETKDKSNTPSDVGEVFSDALKVVTSLNDNDIYETELLNEKPDVKGKKIKKPKKQKADPEIDQNREDQPKVGLWKRLFGNVKDEKSKKDQLKNDQEEAGSEPKKAAKKSKPPKGKKGTAATLEDDNKTGNGKVDKKSAAKKEKKVKQKKQKEIIQVIDEIEVEEGRINRLGAFIVFTFFGLLALFLYVGTNLVSYTLSIQNATKYFDNNKYTEAYNEVYGIEFKDEDMELYDKIMTVMFVNKQLNSYNNYYTIGKYPEALDSLLKGLKRYDKYIELATLLGIESDMDYVREQILAELDIVFHISEKEAMKINSFENMSEYSLEVYDVVLENMNN